MSWANEETYKFIDLYKNEPAIWNPKHEFYKDRSKVQEAWSRLEYEMQIPISELRKKKETLMSIFRLHYKKIVQSIQSNEDEIYRPIWIFYEPMESFLKEVYEMPNADSDAFASTSFQDYDDQEQEMVPKSRSKRKKRDVKTTRVIKGYSNMPIELQDVNKEMSTVLNTLNQTLKSSKRTRNSSSSREEDDCDLYGRLLAKRLRQFPETERQEIMYELDGLVLSRCQGTVEIPNSSDLSDS